MGGGERRRGGEKVRGGKEVRTGEVSGGEKERMGERRFWRRLREPRLKWQQQGEQTQIPSVAPHPPNPLSKPRPRRESQVSRHLSPQPHCVNTHTCTDMNTEPARKPNQKAATRFWKKTREVDDMDETGSTRTCNEGEH